MTLHKVEMYDKGMTINIWYVLSRCELTLIHRVIVVHIKLQRAVSFVPEKLFTFHVHHKWVWNLDHSYN